MDGERLDVALLRRKLAQSREKAAVYIKAGSVLVNGVLCTKPSERVTDTAELTITAEERFVGRGGYKLEHALAVFGIDVKGIRALDIGASTGGFTDCLLQHGAQHVTAIDVGHSQMDARIASDPRVNAREGVNARDIVPEDFGSKFDLIVVDVSFISLLLIFPAALRCLRDNGQLVALIKPQFEAGKSFASKKGIVKTVSVHTEVLERVISGAEAFGLYAHGLTRSPITGSDGNKEFLAVFDLTRPVSTSSEDIKRITGSR